MKLHEIKDDGMLLLSLNVQDQIKHYLNDIVEKHLVIDASDYGADGETDILLVRGPGVFSHEFEEVVAEAQRHLAELIGVLPFSIETVRHTKGMDWKARLVRLD